MSNDFKTNNLGQLPVGGKSQAAFIVGAIVLVLAWMSFYTVGPGNRGVQVRLGAVLPGVVEPGAHWKIPLLDQVVEINVRVQKFMSQETAASHDLQNVTSTVAINYHLDADKVDVLFQTVGDSMAVQSKVLIPSVANAVKAVTARYDAEDLIIQRDEVRLAIEEHIRSALQVYSIHIDAVNITDFAFSREYSNAIENKQVAQQRALQARYELQKTEIDARQQVVQAQAKAEATIAAAEAEAKALELKRKAVTQELILLDAVQKWDGKLPTVYSSGENGMMPLLDLQALSKTKK